MLNMRGFLLICLALIACVAARATESKENESLGAENMGKESLLAEGKGIDSLGAESIGKESLLAESKGLESLGAESMGKESLLSASKGKESLLAASKGKESLTSKTKQKDILKKILDSKVKTAELYARKNQYGKAYGSFGVVVTTWAGKKLLVHKGFGLSPFSSSAVTDARSMDNRWHLMLKLKVTNVEVRDYLKVAGKYFHPKYDNAFIAAQRMMELGRSRSYVKIGKAE